MCRIENSVVLLLNQYSFKNLVGLCHVCLLMISKLTILKLISSKLSDMAAFMEICKKKILHITRQQLENRESKLNKYCHDRLKSQFIQITGWRACYLWHIKLKLICKARQLLQ